MRNEKTMLELIIAMAQKDERVRAVMMNGSRVNPNARRDFFQDYDIVYFVTEMESFTKDPAWINEFGERMILQTPDEMGDPPPENTLGFAYLMQFMDGNRIDLSLFPISHLKDLGKDSLSLVLLDKDGIFKPFPPPDESGYLPTPPTEKQFADCCNEFWWVCPYVAKGLWRSELPYAKHMLDTIVRDELIKMLAWTVGIKTQFQVNPGKFGKYLKQYLEPDQWDSLVRTYSDADDAHTWDALFSMCNLFRKTAIYMAGQFSFSYPYDEDAKVSAHLAHVRHLPKDTKEMY
jgi:aminoglycoside 6-adenylyltransferase